MAQLIGFADRMGVERLCVYMGMSWSRDPSPEEFRKQNDDVLQALKDWSHRAFGFVYVNAKHVQESLEEINRCIGDGPMVGVKLWVAHNCRSEELDPIVRRTAELKAVIFQTTWLKTDGQEPAESTPMDLAQLASRHPEATILCGHTGGNWEIGIRAIRPFRNVFADTGGGDPAAGFVEMAVRELGAERVIFGSDIGGRSMASQLAKVVGADIPEAAKQLILGENLKRLLTPILREKGVRF